MTNDDSSTDLTALQAQLAQLQADADGFRDLAARAQADLQNAKARAEREAADMRKFATESVVRRILPTLDNFARAFTHIPDDIRNHEWIKGVAAVEQDLMRHMQDIGLKRMDSLGKIADPAIHEILTTGPGAEGVVTEVLEEGYELNGKVLRPAKVKVGAGE